MDRELDRLRVDNVGSLLRPEALKVAFAEHDAGRLGDEQLRDAQDRAIRDVVDAQQASGLPVVTDGEFRRRHFNDSFADVAGFAGGGYTPVAGSLPASDGTDAAGPGKEQLTTVRRQVNEPLRLVRNRLREEFEFTRSLATRPVKTTLVNPDGVAQRFDETGSSREVYPDAAAFLDAVVEIEREIIAGVVAAGCRYVQLDAPRYTAYLDDQWKSELRARGDDPQRALERAIRAENAVIEGFPEVTFALHICRGNRRSKWHFNGAYDEIAEHLGALKHQRLLLEYDSDRAGGFEPLRLVPDGTTVVLGLITTKDGRLEDADELKRRIEEASRYVPLERLALSTQCGFASVMEGNLLSEADQWRKLGLMLDVAADVWG